MKEYTSNHIRNPYIIYCILFNQAIYLRLHLHLDFYLHLYSFDSEYWGLWLVYQSCRQNRMANIAQGTEFVPVRSASTLQWEPEEFAIL